MRPEIYLNKAGRNGRYKFNSKKVEEEELLWLHTETYKPIIRFFENEILAGKKKVGQNYIITEEDLYLLCSVILTELARKQFDNDDNILCHRLAEKPERDEWYYQSLKYVLDSVMDILHTFDFENHTVVYNRG